MESAAGGGMWVESAAGRSQGFRWSNIARCLFLLRYTLLLGLGSIYKIADLARCGKVWAAVLVLRMTFVLS